MISISLMEHQHLSSRNKWSPCFQATDNVCFFSCGVRPPFLSSSIISLSVLHTDKHTPESTQREFNQAHTTMLSDAHLNSCLNSEQREVRQTVLLYWTSLCFILILGVLPIVEIKKQQALERGSRWLPQSWVLSMLRTCKITSQFILLPVKVLGPSITAYQPKASK